MGNVGFVDMHLKTWGIKCVISLHREYDGSSTELVPNQDKTINWFFFMFAPCINSIKALFYCSKLVRTIIKP